MNVVKTFEELIHAIRFICSISNEWLLSDQMVSHFCSKGDSFEVLSDTCEQLKCVKRILAARETTCEHSLSTYHTLGDSLEVLGESCDEQVGDCGSG